MRGFRLLLLAALVSCGGGAKSTTPRKPLTARDIVQLSSPSIVRIEAKGPGGEQVGTGFIVGQQGVVATNLHVIAGTSEISVKMSDGAHYRVAQIINVDPGRDLALVKFDPPRPVPSLRLGDSSKVSAGDQIVAIGNPLGVFENTVSEGLISSVREVCSASDVATKNPRCPGELTFLQISAPISQGSSGGPLFNQYGEVVGVTTAIIASGQLINLAMPANYLKPLIASPQPMAPDEFAKKTRELTDVAASDDGPKIRRNIPSHASTLFQGCKPEQIGDMVTSIQEAIEVGAPLYNKGEIEACFRIYEGTAIRYERDAGCPGISSAFGDGLLRVKTLASYKEKAWAMRDTFDGLLNAAESWVKANGKLPEPKK
ncbi:MAG: S1C family serine protease [Kofleriaceae bacterium]